jgi:hypothetical protein
VRSSLGRTVRVLHRRRMTTAETTTPRGRLRAVTAYATMIAATVGRCLLVRAQGRGLTATAA